ncbi:MAG TPA: ABC transporter substrate-binding protein [Nitrososphaera sp.]|nr:ABC transporter substrate-binding protein [Nitrososphaera sp.]
MDKRLYRRPVVLPSVVFYVFGLLTFFYPVAANAADQPVEKVRIAYSGISGSQTAIWVAYEQGFFRKNGLDVELIYIEGAPLVVQTLVSGDVTAAAVSGAAVIQSNLQGSGVVMTAGFLNTLDYKLMVSKDITQPDHLKGKSLAVSRFGSSSDFATRYALETYGLVPGKDVTLVQIGSQPERFAALASGRIQGALIAIPVTAKAKKAGFNTLADLQMLGLEYPQNGLAVTQGLIKSKPALIRNMTKAFVEAIHYFKTHRKETLAIYRKYLKTDDMEALEETYEAVGLNLVPEKPYPTMKGIRIVLKEMASKNPKAEAATPDQFVDLTFIRELDKSGFIDRLYKAQPVVASREDAGSSPASPVIKEKPKPAPVKEAASIALGASSLPQTYTVTAGDTLSRLAFRFYGAPHKWPQIHQANADTLKNPNYLYIGQQLLIPPDGKRGG